MDIKTIKPQAALSKYIDFYYFIKADSVDFKSIHYSFPHTINVVSIYEHAGYDTKLGHVEIFNDLANDYLTLLQGKCQIPLKVELTGQTNRISIFFKPFGANHFIDTALGKIMTKTTNRLADWDNDPHYKGYLQKCFSTENLQERIDYLEAFLLTKFKAADYRSIEKAIGLLCDFDRDYTVEEILHEINMPLRTFNRRFKEVIGISPIEYRRIARFRHSMNNKLFSLQFKRLTDIGYNSNFYDQSYFIKMYKKLTGSNPSAFFKTIEKLGDDKLIFQILKN